MIIPFEPPGRSRQPRLSMADERHDPMLDSLLAHREPLSGDAFVLRVMHRTRSERRRRRAILLGFGLLGAVFGALGAVLLAEPLARLFTDLPGTTLMQAVLLAGGIAAFYAWFMGDDLGVPR